MSIKSIKEKELLVNLAKSFGQKVDPILLSEVEQHKKFENNIRESIRSSVFEDLSKALADLKQEADRVSIEYNYPLPPSLEDLDNIITEEENDLDKTETEKNASPVTRTNTLTELASEAITASTKRDSFQQPDPLLVAPDINSIQKKIRYLEQWLGKISLTGPGGGAGSAQTLDRATKLITSPYYEITTKDYYVGVNYNDPVTIVLPTAVNNGTEYIIKDESGNAKHNPITVIGTVDNDVDGFILRISNGAVQLLYRNGWRIV
ncbi:MAG: hypothetical protein EB127_14405 [Alphaproteobacteria bacterium]|nr:hypothetical protein [Alphaproteobacteria bacterium]